MYRKAWWGYILALVVALAGFWPSVKAGGLDPLHVAHGLLAVAWMLLLIAQGWLIAYRHNRLHRWLGWTSVVIVPLFVASGLVMDVVMLTAKDGLPWRTAIKLGWLDLWSLVLFAALFAMGLVKRKKVAQHARYMTATVIILMPPAIGRLLAAPMHGLGPTLVPISVMMSLLVIVLMAFDWRSRRLLHPAYVWVLVLMVGVAATYPMTAEPWFGAAARRLLGLA